MSGPALVPYLTEENSALVMDSLDYLGPPLSLLCIEEARYARDAGCTNRHRPSGRGNLVSQKSDAQSIEIVDLRSFCYQ